MMIELIEEAERWDLEPKLASLWQSNTHADENKEGMTMETKGKGRHKIPFQKSFKILAYIFNPTGKSQCLYARCKTDRSKDVLWRLKRSRMVEPVYSVSIIGCESRSWNQQARHKFTGWETQRDETTWVSDCTTTARLARIRWTEVLAESMERTIGMGL